jgi:hypothetical protein
MPSSGMASGMRKNIQVPISAVSTSSHFEQRSQARQSQWYCRKRWESRSVPNFIQRIPLGIESSILKSVGLFCFIRNRIRAQGINRGEYLLTYSIPRRTCVGWPQELPFEGAAASFVPGSIKPSPSDKTIAKESP